MVQAVRVAGGAGLAGFGRLQSRRICRGSAAKRALAFWAALLCTAAVSAQAIEWRSDLAAARAESAETGRPLLVIITAGAWCDPCIWFRESTLEDEHVARLVDSRFVPYLVNDSDTAAGVFVIDRVPSIQIFRPGEGEPFFTTSGPVSADALTTYLERIAPSAPEAAPDRVIRYRYNGGDIVFRGGSWISRDAGLPPEFELYEEDEGYRYLRNNDAGVLLALPRQSGAVWRWDRTEREWVSAGEAELLP